MFNFNALVSRIKYIPRWSLMRQSRQEYLAEHTTEVMHIAHTLAAVAKEKFGADVVYTATGWPGHTAFIDPRTEEFKADTLEEFLKLDSRIVTTSPLTICENALFGPMGASGDVWGTPYKAATIGPKDIMNARDRFELHNLMMGNGSSWQRMVSRLELYGPISKEFPASILRLGKGTCYVSEAIAAPFGPWYNGIPDSEVSV